MGMLGYSVLRHRAGGHSWHVWDACRFNPEPEALQYDIYHKALMGEIVAQRMYKEADLRHAPVDARPPGQRRPGA